MILTFNPENLKSSFECVDFLKEKGITISQKMGARILALNASGVQLSLVILEDSGPGTSFEKFFLSDSFIKTVIEKDFVKIKKLFDQNELSCMIECINEEEILKIVSDFEIGVESKPSYDALPVGISKHSKFNLLSPTSISPNSILSDRRFMEEVMLNFLDSEDSKIVVESMRKLVRVALFSSIKPWDLFRSSFSREIPGVWEGAVSIFKEMIDQDFGRIIEAFVRETDQKKSDIAFRVLLNRAINDREPFIRELILLIFLKKQMKSNNIELFLINRDLIIPMIKDYPYLVREFIIIIIESFMEFHPEVICAMRDFTIELAGKDSKILKLLLDEMKTDNTPAFKIIISWLISGISLSESERTEIIRGLLPMLIEKVFDNNLMNLAKATLLKLAPQSLQSLSQPDFYRLFPRDMKLFVLELMEKYFQSAVDSISDNERKSICEMIILDLESDDIVVISRVLKARIFRNHILFPLKERIRNMDAIINACVSVFASYQFVEEAHDLMDFVIAFIPDVLSRLFALIEKKLYFSDDIEDYIVFASYAVVASKTQDKEFVDYIIRFLNQLKQKERKYIPVIAASLGVIFKGLAIKKTEALRFVRWLIQSSQISFSEKMKPMADMLISGNLSKKARINLETYLLDRLVKKDINSTQLGLLLEEINRVVLCRDSELILASELISVLAREIAFKATMPTIKEIMSNEAQLKEPSKFLPEYEQCNWSWDDVSQALLIMLRLFKNPSYSIEIKNEIIHIISYVVNHRSHSLFARDGRASSFMLSDVVLFRILSEIIDEKTMIDNFSDYIAKIHNSVFIALDKWAKDDNDPITMNEDLQRFLLYSMKVIHEKNLFDSFDIPLDIENETLRFLIGSAKAGSESAKSFIREAASWNWLNIEAKNIIDSACISQTTSGTSKGYKAGSHYHNDL